MKKHSALSLYILLVPLLMANSPSPELYPEEYSDYDLLNESVVISEEGSSKYVTFSGELVNSGEGIISFRASVLTYRFEGDDYEMLVDDYNVKKPIQGIMPDKSYIFEERFEYLGSSPIGINTYQNKIVSIRGYAEEDILSDIVVSNLIASEGEYNSSISATLFTISFDWNNPGDYSAETMYISFNINENEYVYYEWENLDKEGAGHSNIHVSFPGNIEDQEIENIELFFIRRSYESWGWNFLDSTLFRILIAVAITITALIVIAPIIAITVILIIARKKKKNA